MISRVDAATCDCRNVGYLAGCKGGGRAQGTSILGWSCSFCFVEIASLQSPHKDCAGNTHTHNVSEVCGVKLDDLMYSTETFKKKKPIFYFTVVKCQRR